MIESIILFFILQLLFVCMLAFAVAAPSPAPAPAPGLAPNLISWPAATAYSYEAVPAYYASPSLSLQYPGLSPLGIRAPLGYSTYSIV